MVEDAQLVTFTVALPQAPRDDTVVCLRGDRGPAFEAWGRAVPLEPVPGTLRRVWRGCTDVPFKFDDDEVARASAHTSDDWETGGSIGMGFFARSPPHCEVKFTQERDGHIAWQAGSNVEIRKPLKAYYFCQPRFPTGGDGPGSWGGMPSSEAFQHILKGLLLEVQQGLLDPAGFFEQYSALEDQISVWGSGTEDALEAVVKELAPLVGAEGFVFCCAAVMGHYKTLGAGRWRDKGGVSSGISSYASVPDRSSDMRPWCRHVLDAALREAPGMDPAKVLGPRYRWALHGLGEAAERSYKEGSFEWLPLVPLLRLTGSAPSAKDVSTFAWHPSTLVDSFNNAADAAIAAASAAAPPEAVGADDGAWEGLLEHLPVLISYAPSVDSVLRMARRTSAGTVLAEEKCVDAIMSRLGSLNFDRGDLKALNEALDVIEGFACEELATALLGNSHIPVRHFTESDLLAMVARCSSVPAGEAMTVALKKWLRSSYCKEEKEEVDDDPVDSFGGGLWGIGHIGGMGAKKKRPPEELARERQNNLTAAVAAWKRWLALPCFSQDDAKHAGQAMDRARSVAFELSQATFVKRQPSLILMRSILDLESEIQAAHPAVQEELARIARQAITSAESVAALQVVCSVRKIESPLRLDLALHVACTKGAENGQKLSPGSGPGLRGVLQNSELWARLLGWIDEVGGREHAVEAMASEVRSAVHRVCTELKEHTTNLADLRVAVEAGHRPLLRLAQACSVNKPEGVRKDLEACSSSLSAFDHKLAMLQCYVSLFCRSAGLEVEELEAQLKCVQEDLGKRRLSEVESMFEDLAVLPLVPWLYDLRGSEVFLQLWTHIVQQAKPVPQEPVFTESADQRAEGGPHVPTFRITDCGEPRVNGEYAPRETVNGRPLYIHCTDESVVIYWYDPEEEGEEGECMWRIVIDDRDDDATLYSCTLNAPELPTNSWVAAQGPAPPPTVVSLVEERKAAEVQAVQAVPAMPSPEELIATAREAYLALATRTAQGAATVRELDGLARLPAGQAQRELELMRDVGQRYDTNAPAGDWVPKAVSSVQTLRTLHRVRNFAPAALHLHAALSSLFSGPAVSQNDDEFVAGLQRVAERTRDVDDLPVAEVGDLIAPCTPVTSGLKDVQLDFIATFAAHDGLLQWLLGATDTEQFNRLIKVVRPYTDNPRLLEALASLQQLRTFLAELLYQKPPFKSLSGFIDELSKLEVGESELGELCKVQATFELVLELLTSHTRAPGVQALHEVKTITEAGRFILTCAASTDEQLVCHFGESNELRFAELVEMRRLLLMTDIPEELEDAAQMHVLVADFITKLQIMEEMREVVAALFSEGHFAYLPGSKVMEIKAGDPAEVLTKHLRDLKAQLLGWRQAVEASRTSHYFLNYFKARELQLLISDLRLLQEGARQLGSPDAVSKDKGKLSELASSAPWSRMWPLLRWVVPAADELMILDRCLRAADTLSGAGGAAEDTLRVFGEILEKVFEGVEPATREVPMPTDRGAVGDLLIQSSAEGQGSLQSVFVCCAEGEHAVTELVLSIFVRRGRVPESEEVLMCTASTSLEEVELLLRRFASARAHARENRLFCAANVHVLPYAVQHGVVEAIRRLEASPQGLSDASALVLVSGESDQMLLNSLIDRQVLAKPLSREALRAAMHTVATTYCGSIEVVAADINGGGKTHHILRRVAALQEQQALTQLHQVAIRETTTAGELVQALLGSTQVNDTPTAIYLDLAHILPPSADVWFFELLLVGALRDPVSSKVYHRRDIDHFFIEVPNSPHERTAAHLTFCTLLPVTFLRMEPGRLEFQKPQFEDDGKHVGFVGNDRLMITYHFLEAMERSRFSPGTEAFDPEWAPELMEPPEPAMAFQALSRATCKDDSPPSFQLFMTFANFVGSQFQKVQAYELLNLQLLEMLEMPTLRDSFCKMLLETSADFSLRQIPKLHLNLEVTGEFERAANYRALASRAPRLDRVSSGKGPVALGRAMSGQGIAELQRVRSDRGNEAAVENGGAGRIDSINYVRRFDHMISWEKSEHPIVVFYSNPFGLVEGLDVFSLNRSVVENYIGRDLKLMLEQQGIPLGKDWKDIKTSEAVRIVRRVEGWSEEQMEAEQAPSNYVVTVDNFLKLLSIQMRLKFGLPVVLMGETGCGKTSIVRFLAACLGYRLETLDIHGGISDRDITLFLERCIAIANGLPENSKVLVFFDEINAANCMGLFKSLLLERRLGSKLIPDSVRLIACCNPYRLRQSAELEEVALVYNHHAKDSGGLADPMRHLVYRVHPLPESLIDVVFDFGALSEATEDLYVEAVLRKELPDFEKDEDDKGNGETFLSIALAGEAGHVRSEIDVLADQPAGSTVVDINCTDNPAVQEQKGTGFGISDDQKRVWLGSDIQGTFEIHVLDTAAAKRAEERKAKRREAKERKERKAAAAAAARGGGIGSSLGTYAGPSSIGTYGSGGSYYSSAVTSYYARDSGGAGWGGSGGGWGWGYYSQPSDYEQFLLTFKALICASQRFVIEANGGEKSVVSLRDVARAAKVFKWFLRYYSQLQGDFVPTGGDVGAEHIEITEELRPHLRSAVILTLGYCYHSRLTREQRAGYRERLCTVWRTLVRTKPGVQWLKLESADGLQRLIEQTQNAFVQEMDLGQGIALNEALRENLFMLLVSIMNQIPILVIGKPGASKSLSMEILQSNLNGEVSGNDFFKSMPAVEVFPYQCSPLSTPEGVQGAFDSARKYRVEGSKTIVCVLLDEVGLAEESPHLPLKVLHRELEHLDGLACVGISNWGLDAAKMNRCVTLYRPAPTVDDLCATAEGMVASSNLKAYLQSLSRAFFEVYRSQQRPDFWGLREFYSTVRVINAELRRKAAAAEKSGGSAAAMTLEPDVLMKTVLRNFGGRPEAELDGVVANFFQQCGMNQAHVRRLGTIELIRQNLAEPEARHLMLLTRNIAALRLLFESGLLTHDRAEVLFGSTFPGDQSDVSVASMLQSIKAMMRLPIVLVLVHCDSLYESLYDLLNQHYMEYGGQRYVRIAHGSSSRQCPMHDEFRVIVITEVGDAYHRLAPPLLNRFEKQIFLRDALLVDSDQRELSAMTRMFGMLICDATTGAEDEKIIEGSVDVVVARKLVPGFHRGLLVSLVLAMRKAAQSESAAAAAQDGEAEEEASAEATARGESILAALRRLLWVMPPESICACMGRDRLSLRDNFGFDVIREYFEHQRHSDLPSFMEWIQNTKAAWCDARGSQACVVTRVPVGAPMKAILPETSLKVQNFSLHELSSSQDLERVIGDFYAAEQDLLVVQVDLAACSQQMLEHCRFACEKHRSELLRQHPTGTPRFVVLAVHLQQGSEQHYSFDFDAHWWHAFLDALEPQAESGLPSLTQMLRTNLVDCVTSLDDGWLMAQCFRSALARLVYPRARTSDELKVQIHQLLALFQDPEFVLIIREPFQKALSDLPEGLDPRWYASTASSPNEVSRAGTFQAALHRRIISLYTEALIVLLSHLDRNDGLALISQAAKRSMWLRLARYVVGMHSVQSGLAQGISGQAKGLQQVGHDALTVSKPFQADYPFSWIVCMAIDSLRSTLESVPAGDRHGALASQFQLMDLRHAVDLCDGVQDYMTDFSAMRLQWSPRVSRQVQSEFLKLFLAHTLGHEPSSLLEVHLAYWQVERRITFSGQLLNAVPASMTEWRRLIKNSTSSGLQLDLQLLEVSLEALVGEIMALADEVHDPVWLRAWIQREDVVWGIAQDIIRKAGSAQQPDAALLKLRTLTLPQLRLCVAFIEDVALPLQLEQRTVARWLGPMLRTPRGLTALESALLCSRELLSVKEVPDSPSKPQWTKLRPGWPEKSEQGLTKADACAEFLEHWILDVCLESDSVQAEAPNDSCLEVLCGVASGRPLIFNADGGVAAAAASLKLPHGIGVIEEGVLPRSRAFNLALVRQLIASANAELRNLARSKLLTILAANAAQKGHFDTKLAMHIVAVDEEMARQQQLSAEAKGQIDLDGAFASGTPSDVALRTIAQIRCCLADYGRTIVGGNEPALLECQGRVEPLLQPHPAAPVRSMRLLVLKHLQRSVGTGQVRNMLGTPPLSKQPWVVSWASESDSTLERFIGAAGLPQWNPFLDARGFTVCADALNTFIASSNLESMASFARKIAAKPADETRRALGTFLMACCELSGLRKATEAKGRKPDWRAKLIEWLRTSEDLPLRNELERKLLLLFAGDDSILKGVSPADRAALDIFEIRRGAAPERLLGFRLLAHLAAASLSSPEGSVLDFFHKMVFSPEQLVGSYLPGMGEDIREMLQAALKEKDANIWSDSAHWYQCPKGHQYFIADCGRPMEQAKCPECGESIGGREHESVAGNTQLESKDKSPAGYTLKAAGQEDADSDSFRGIGRVSARAIRLLQHGAMLLGLVARGAFAVKSTPKAVEDSTQSSGQAGSKPSLRRQVSLPAERLSPIRMLQRTRSGPTSPQEGDSNDNPFAAVAAGEQSAAAAGTAQTNATGSDRQDNAAEPTEPVMSPDERLALEHRFLDLSKEAKWQEIEDHLARYPDLVNVQPSGRWSVLHQAAEKGDSGIINRLLDLKADPHARTRDGRTPFGVAREESIRTLLQNAEVAAQHRLELETRFLDSVDAQEWQDVFNMLSEQPELVNACLAGRQSALRQAVEAKSSEVVQQLLALGADVSAKGEDGQLLLDLAEDPAIYELLGAAGARHSAPKTEHGSISPRRVVVSFDEDGNVMAYRPLANRDCTSFGSCESMFIRTHFEKDRKVLLERLGTNAEDLTRMLHLIIMAMRESIADVPANAPVGSAPAPWSPLSLNRRQEWEKMVETKYLGPAWEAPQKLQDAFARWGSGEAEVLVSELRESIDISALPKPVRHQQLPRLFAYRGAPSLSGLRAAVNSQPRAQNNFPLLSHVVEPPFLNFLEALQHLSAVFRWHQLVASHFNCRIERSTSRSMTVRDAISSLPVGDQNEWRSAFEGYRLAWAETWRFVKAYECTAIPEEYAELKMEEDTPLAFMIADEADEGLCPLAFTQWLVQQHNHITQLAAALNGNTAVPEVSSRLLGTHETFQYNESKLLQFVRGRCVTHGEGGSLEYDFPTLERHLRRKLRAPLVTWEHKKFRYVDEQAAATSVLRAALPQRPLSRELEAQISSELGSASVASSCAQLVEQSIAFLLSTSSGSTLGDDAGAMLLSTYLETVLLVTDRLPSKAAEGEVRLWHLDSLLKLLQGMMNCDPMEGVAAKFRSALEGPEEQRLRAAAEQLDLAVLLPALADFAQQHLREQFLNESDSMKSILCMVETLADSELGDLEWFAHFPEDLQMKHWVAVYRSLAGSQQ